MNSRNDLRTLILKIFGVLATDEDLNIIQDMFRNNDIESIEELRKEIAKYLYSKHKGKRLILAEDDTSNLKYLLKLLKENPKKK